MGFLKYRIPNQEAQELVGDFIELESLENSSGFILSDFNHSHYYHFQEGLALGEKNVIEQPYCSVETEYLNQAKAYINALATKVQSKAILSRIKKVEVIKNEAWFDHLCAKYPQAFVYQFESALLGHWIGATPELLVDIEGSKGRTVSLAGTKITSDDSNWGLKELEEQSIVTNYIERVLQKHGSNVEVNTKTELIAGPVKHLLNSFEFEIENDEVVKLVRDLHPTPAVLGYPVDLASQLIQSQEKHNRSFYAGFLGLLTDNDTKLFVNLRCAQLIENEAYLYLGGGLTKDSVPELEWQETENKAKTLLDILQNS